MSGIRKQCQRARKKRAHNLDNHKDADDANRDEKPRAIRLPGAVIVVMNCRHTTSVWRRTDKYDSLRP